MKLLPLRPPPIKSTPGRPPPPAINSVSSANQLAPPSSKTSPVPSVSSSSHSSPSQTTSSVSANQISQRAPKRGPPLPPRPKPGHPLYNSYMVWIHTQTHTHFVCQRFEFKRQLLRFSCLRNRKCWLFWMTQAPRWISQMKRGVTPMLPQTPNHQTVSWTWKSSQTLFQIRTANQNLP